MFRQICKGRPDFNSAPNSVALCTMSEKEGALDSARTVQLAMLVAVGATLILSGPSEARQRLQDALGEVSSLPHDTVAIRRALTSHCEEGLLDLPDHPTLGWLFDHRKEQKGNGEWIYVSCVTIESSCSILDNVAPALRVQDEALYAKSCDSVRTLALPI